MKKKAFTLIELIVLIAIIAVLAAMVAGGYRTVSQRGGAGAPTSGPRQLPPPQAGELGSGSTQFLVNDAAEVARVRAVLERAGYTVEPVTDRINMVYKSQ